MQLCPVLISRLDAALDGQVEIGVLQHDVGIAPAEFEDGLLEPGAGLLRHIAASAGAAGEGHGVHGTMADDPPDLRVLDEEILEDTDGEAGVEEEFLQGSGASGDIGSVLEETDIPGHQ